MTRSMTLLAAAAALFAVSSVVGDSVVFSDLALASSQTSREGVSDITSAGADEAARARVSTTYGKLPLHFEANRGQADEQVRFLSRGGGYSLFLTATEAVVVMSRPVGKETAATTARLLPGKERARETAVLRMGLVGAEPEPEVVGRDELPGKANYFIGNDSGRWHTGVPTYERVEYKGVYPSIDLAYYGNQRQLEYDFVVHPGGDPGVIRLTFEGSDRISLDDDGNLALQMRGSKILLRAPITYQELNGTRQEIASGYVLEGENQVSFKVADYDRTRPLVIDPILSYSTYLGGSGTDESYAIAVDGDGNAYVTGRTQSLDFPTSGSIYGTSAGDFDVFVTKLNAAGSALVYSTYLGGSEVDRGYGIAVDGSGSAYVTGVTWSDANDFPTVNAIQPTHGGYSVDGFVTKLNPAGSALVYSTYLGGSRDEGPSDIAVDSTGSAYVTGYTSSSDFPLVNAVQGTMVSGPEAFVTKFNAAGSAHTYSTFLTGSGAESGRGIAVDGAGSVYVVGNTDSSDFSTLNPFQGARAGATDLFVARLNAAGSALLYSTYLGGTLHDYAGAGIAVDGAGSAYVTGHTESIDFPTTANPFQGANAAAGGPWDAFVTKLNAAGSALVYSTYLGGGVNEWGYSIAVDSADNAYIAGATSSTDFPTSKPIYGDAGGRDAYVTRLNATGTALVYSTYLGGSDLDLAYDIALDGSRNAYVSGWTDSPLDFPTAVPFQAANAGDTDAFVLKIVPCGDGNLDPDEQCDDGYNDACGSCDATCDGAGTGSTYGDGELCPETEECDDGNLIDGDCCSSTCELEPDGSDCEDDGDVCSSDTCDGAGTCVHSFEPAPACFTALKSKLQVRDRADDSRDQLDWKWKKGAAVDQVELDDPSATATYTLCVYDTSGGVSTLATSLTVPPGPLWDDRDPRGWQYKDRGGASDGVQQIKLKPNVAGRSVAQVKAKGVNLPTPTPFSGTEFFDQDLTVTVQLVNSDTSVCWTSPFTAARTNAADRFKATSP